MKTRIFSTVYFIALCISLQTAHASSLVYGATLSPVPVGSGPALGANVVLPTVSSTFTAPDYSGTLFSTVLNNDTSNPYGLNKLTFTYLIQMDATTIDPVSRFTISSFANYLTDASEKTAISTDIVPSSVNRSGAPGSLVRFSFDGALLGAGTTR